MEQQTMTIGELEKVLMRTSAGQELLAERAREEDRKRLVRELRALRKQEAEELRPL